MDLKEQIMAAYLTHGCGLCTVAGIVTCNIRSAKSPFPNPTVQVSDTTKASSCSCSLAHSFFHPASIIRWLNHTHHLCQLHQGSSISCA